ncbi:transcription factor TFIIIB component B'' homolog Bdp1 [Lycorma delicatula]|uniref:transcription factor TFIIIB component B'' homolog Bdp1 n=1 Tax=Lycorma delicatula TaxID=130591 RepID=UPI003F50E767
MASRRLKFKPKPLVGLIRRNKDQNNEQESTTKSDLVEEKNQVSTGNNEYVAVDVTDSVQVNQEPDKCDNDSINQLKKNEVSFSQESTSSVLEQNVEDNNGGCIVESNVNNDIVVQSDLKSDINSKIKDVLSSSNDNSCKSIINSNNNQNVSDLNIVQNDRDGINNFKGTDKHNTTSVISDQNTSKDESVLSNSHEKPGTTVCNKNSSVDFEADKKENKNNSSQKMIPRFGKGRFKPVLANIVRKKDTSDVAKNEETLVEVPVIVNSSSVVEESSKVIENDRSCIVNTEISSEKENIDKNILEEPTKLPEKEPDTVEKTVEENEKLMNNKVNDNISSSDIETDAELNIRSPVKLFCPKKRQRSQGTSFSNMTIKAMQTFKDKFKDGNVDKSKLMMRDLIFYNPSTNPMPQRSAVKSKKEHLKLESNVSNSTVEDMLEEEKVDDVENEESEAVPVPQLKVGPDGQIMIDPKSLVIETTGMQKSRANLENSEVVQENEFSYSKFHKRKVHRSDWTAEETLLFYKALNDLGADFSLMQSLFPKRTRRDLKLKFKKEERTNVHLIDKAMTSCGNFDFTALENELKKDREERMRKLEEQKKLKEEKKRERQEKKAIPKPKRKRVQKKSEAVREFDEEDTGVVRVGKKYEDKISKILKFKRQQKDSDDCNDNKKGNGKKKCNKNNTLGKKPRKRKRLEAEDEEEAETTGEDKRRERKEIENESRRLPYNLFDFRLNVSSDDGIVSDYNDEDNQVVSNCDEYDDDNDLDSEIVALNLQMFTKTRSGRQPKSKLIKQDSVTDNYQKIKKFKRINHDKDEIDENINTSDMLSSASNNGNLSIDKTNSMTEEEIQQIYQKKFERCYRLFEEPLDLSCPNLRDDIEDDLNESSGLFVKEVEKSVSLPIIADDLTKEIITSVFSSESNLNDSREQVRGISENLQIMEELTFSESDHINNISNSSDNSNLVDCGVYIVPDNSSQYVSRAQFSDESNDEHFQTEVTSSRISEHQLYCSNYDEVIKDQENIHQYPHFIMNGVPAATSSSSALLGLTQPQIQVISNEHLSYIVRQSGNVILQNIEENSDIFVTNDCKENATTETNEEAEDDNNESITHSKIHCYPSSDHTYTSLTPKPVEQKNTYLILTPINSLVTTEQPQSTILVYPKCHENVATS